MKCHYQVLGVARNASDDDIKKAYRKLALKWHPDKNLENQDEAKEQFQLVQQAWEILSDPRERTWYDNHREAILKGGIEKDYEDDSINLFPYFSASCFKGYGDNEKGFYTVYRNLFEKLAAEDAEFVKDSDTEIEVPGFGDSQSSYMEVVHKFYSYWQSYSTKKSYAWLDPYDIRNLPGHSRHVFKLAEKENKKVRDKARRERNEQVRNLVAFVRKRDKRVRAHTEKLAARAKENLRKSKERRKAQLLERQKLLHNHTESEWSKFSNIEAELEKIEANLAEEFGEDDKRDKFYYCMHCDKLFKTHRTFANHQKSEKHKEIVSTFNAIMTDYNENCDSSRESDSNTESDALKGPKLATDSQMPDFLLNPSTRPQSDDPRPHSINEDSKNDSPAELISDDEENPRHPRLASEKKKTADVPLATGPEMEGAFGFSPKVENEIEDITSEDELISDQEEEIAQARQKKKKKKKKRNVQNPNPLLDRASGEDTESINEELWLSKKQRKKLQQRKATITKQSRDNEEKQEAESEREETEEANSAVGERPKADKAKKRSKRKEREERRKEKDSASDEDLSHRCVSCSSEFPSKNKLFEHLKKTGHSVYIPELLKCKKNPERKERTTAKGKDGSDKKKR